MLIITTMAASLIGLLYVKLSLKVIQYRRKHGLSLGDGGNEEVHRAIRAQANLTEYAPIGLILIGCLEFNRVHWSIPAVLATLFVLGRILHPLGMQNSSFGFQPRVRGMQLTLWSLIGLIVANIAVLVISIFT